MKTKAEQKLYYQANKEKCRAYGKSYYASHRDYYRNYYKEWRLGHKNYYEEWLLTHQDRSQMYRDRQMEKMRNNRVAKLEAKLEANPPMFRGIIVGMPDIISLTSIVEESRNTQIPLAKRTIRYYVTHKVIDKPIRIGRSAYFKRGYILPVMKCITLLRRHFSASLKQIRMVMSTNDDRLDLLNQEIYNFLDRYVARPTYYLYLVDDFIKELTTKIPIDYSKIESTASEKYEKSFIVERSKLPNLS